MSTANGHPSPNSGSSNTSRSSQRRLVPVRRLWLHLTRQRARAAIFLAVITILLYALVPDLSFLSASYQDPVRQFLLILTSVAAGALFLPELSSDLWSLTPNEVRNLIPDDRRRSLAKALIAADSADAE